MTEIHISSWQKEQDALRQQQEEINNQYKKLRENLKQSRNVKYCVVAMKKEIGNKQIRKEKVQII